MYDYLVLPQDLPFPGSLHFAAVGLQDGYFALFSPFALPQGL